MSRVLTHREISPPRPDWPGWGTWIRTKIDGVRVLNPWFQHPSQRFAVFLKSLQDTSKNRRFPSPQIRFQGSHALSAGGQRLFEVWLVAMEADPSHPRTLSDAHSVAQRFDQGRRWASPMKPTRHAFRRAALAREFWTQRGGPPSLRVKATP